MLFLLHPAVASKEPASFGIVELPIVSADPAEFEFAVRVAACHMVAPFILLDWGLAL
jgi:hypothetical protein